MKTKIIMLSLFFLVSTNLSAQENIKGRVVDLDGKGVAAVSVRDAKNGNLTSTDTAGYFNLEVFGKILAFSHILYDPIDIHLKERKEIQVVLTPIDNSIDAVSVFSTGYSSIPKERATGSFVELNKEVLEKRVTSNILENIEGLAPGLQFDRRRGGAEINIRGINTLSSEMMGPLIIVDNFPFSGDINSLNPLEIESVTLLKDAAAASIWGARAGNGVIVIKTKKSKGGSLSVEGSVNMRLGNKTNLFYYPTISSSDFIDVEKMLFENGHYDPFRNPTISKQYIFSPVVELLYKHQEEKISASEMESAINAYRNLDYRKDLMDGFLQKPVLQQYQVAVSGGNELLKQRMSLGYSKQLNDKIGNDQQKFNINWNTVISPTRRIEVSTGLLYTYAKNHSGGTMDFPLSVGGGKSNLYPYAQLVSSQGEALAVPNLYNFNYVDNIAVSGIKDWRYRPLNEIKATEGKMIGQFLNANLSLKYSLTDELSVEGLYNIELNHTKTNNLRSEESFYVRDLYNRFGYLSDGEFRSHIPDGGILDASFSDVRSQRARVQVSFEKKIGQHGVSFFGGAELSDQLTNMSSSRYYGYNDMMTTQPVDLLSIFPIYDGLGASSTIPNMASLGQLRNRFVSFYVNGAYNLTSRYVITASARRDASNLFGVKTNERWNPLWSMGILWNVHEEAFFDDIQWMDVFRLKGTYGHSGNAGGVASSLPVIGYLTPPSSAIYKIKRARISSLPNESLKWENVATLNIGTEFSAFRQRLHFSFDYFFKQSTDLISDDPLDPTSGFTNIRRNVAEVIGHGFDMQLRTRNLDRDFKWETTVMLSKAINKVESFFGTETSSLFYTSYTGRSLSPLENKMLYPVLSYRFAGLDPETGDPQGWVDEVISKDYSTILRDSLDGLVYHGTGLPIFHGAIQNTFSYKNLDLWINISFKFGHFFQRETVRYHDLYNSWIGHADFAKRWQSSGDENFTTVPSMIYPANSIRDDFYSFSEANIDRGDLVRLQDLRLSYNYVPNSGRKVKNIAIFLTASNLGILWKSTNSSLDPDFINAPLQRTYAVGVKLSM